MTKERISATNFMQSELRNAVFHRGKSPPRIQVEGQYYWNMTLKKLFVYDGEKWREIVDIEPIVEELERISEELENKLDKNDSIEPSDENKFYLVKWDEKGLIVDNEEIFVNLIIVDNVEYEYFSPENREDIIISNDMSVGSQNTVLTTNNNLELEWKSYYYEHVQYDDEVVWIINHNLGRMVNVSTYDNLGHQIEGLVTIISNDTVEVEFSVPISGKAVIS